MSKKVKGFLKGCKVPDASKTGYRDTWDMGEASIAKKKWRIKGTNKPST